MSLNESPEMIEKKIPSALPYWAVGVTWILYALILPLYRITDMAIAALVSVAAFIAAKKLIPPRTVMVEAPAKPVYDGKFALGTADKEFLAKLKAADDAIENEEVSARIRKIAELSRSIFEYVSDKPEKVGQIRKFTSYYLPTTLKILDSYDRMEEQRVKGNNITKAMESIEKALSSLEEAFAHQLDSLYSAETLDIETDIEVMEAMLKQEGFGGQSGLRL